MTPSAFSQIVTEFWGIDGVFEAASDECLVVVDPSLREDLSLSLLSVAGGPRIAAVTPAFAAGLGVSHSTCIGVDDLRSRVARAGCDFHGADHLFYLPEREILPSASPAADIRMLSSSDAEAFARLCEEAPEDDLEDAFVELDHWLVCGAFTERGLVSVASMYPWQGSRLADVGVLTLPAHRGQGHARRVVLAIAAEARRRRYEPQYRCQLDNLASVRLAASAGFQRFGAWDVVTAR
ncbi:GNAT family N-acetyltransferase [Microbacterium sediminicola]|uniref:GNAT family N-acetyltransferase n=1 Tax=Microbacterium sediminicola TaxID=415210 RepID=UPI0031D117B8